MYNLQCILIISVMIFYIIIVIPYNHTLEVSKINKFK